MSNFRAIATVTFHASKPGLWIQPGKSHAGEVERVEIGIPAGGPVSPQLGSATATVGTPSLPSGCVIRLHHQSASRTHAP